MVESNVLQNVLHLCACLYCFRVQRRGSASNIISEWIKWVIDSGVFGHFLCLRTCWHNVQRRAPIKDSVSKWANTGSLAVKYFFLLAIELHIILKHKEEVLWVILWVSAQWIKWVTESGVLSHILCLHTYWCNVQRRASAREGISKWANNRSLTVKYFTLLAVELYVYVILLCKKCHLKPIAWVDEPAGDRVEYLALVIVGFCSSIYKELL